MTKPNVIFIYADDLGAGMLSCYGQKYFKTPNIDRICEEGVNFTNAHGCHICAPARASLLCGVHDAHSGRWGFTAPGLHMEYLHGNLSEEKISELLHNTGMETLTDGTFLPHIFKKAGYKTLQVGKLDWGFNTCPDEVKAHGWDEHFGLYDHWMCQGYYAPFVHENGKRVDIKGNTDLDCGRAQYKYINNVYQKNGDDTEKGRVTYIPEVFDNQALKYITENKDNPFFLYYPTPLPHSELSIPAIDPAVENISELTLQEKIYASMVLFLDRSVGKIYDKLKELGILENTLLIFSSDNGHSPHYTAERKGGKSGMVNKDGVVIDNLNVRFDSVSCADIFDGNNGRSGSKSSSFEGGTRVPLMMRYPKVIKSHTVNNALVANYDFMNTCAEMLGVEPAKQKDSVSYWKSLTGEKGFKQHDYIVFASKNGPAIISKDGFKLRTYLKSNYQVPTFGACWDDLMNMIALELYNLNDDFKEENNIIKEYPLIAEKLLTSLLIECGGNLINGTIEPHFLFTGSYTYKPYYSTKEYWHSVMAKE